MSHIAEVKTVFTSLDDMQAAAERLSGQLLRDRKTFKAYFNTDNRCQHVMRFPGASYEVGIRAQPDGTFRLAWDSYSTGGLLPIMGDLQCGRFSQAYAVVAAKRAARLKGYACREKARSDGAVELELIAR